MSFRLLRKILFYRKSARVLILISSGFATCFGLLGPFFQKDFIDHLTHQNQMFQIFDNVSPLLLITFAFACLICSYALGQTTNYLGFREAFVMQRLLAQELYDKSLELRSDSFKGKTVGELVSVCATDIPGATILLEQTIPTAANIIFPLILAPLALIYFFELPMMPTLGAMGILAIINFWMAYRQSILFLNFKKLAADRVGLANEWIQNIRTLRILGWLEAFEEKIFQVRKVETKNRVEMVTNGQIMNGISSSVTFVFNFITIFSLVWLDQPQKITTGTLMSLLWIVGIFLTRPFRQMPWMMTFLFDAWTSIKRMSTFLELQNENPQKRLDDFAKIQTRMAPLSVKNLNLEIQGTQILKNISFDIKEKEFVAIVGEVGSGKTLLLLSLLGETGASFEEYKIGENAAHLIPLTQLRQFFSFVPQEGFIMSASLRENVAFEYDLDKNKDSEIAASLKNCQFDLQSESLSQSLDTEIGERGVNLSGGQKQRVSLARVDYLRAPILLLDDCLSALDVDTEKRLIQNLMKGLWKDRTRILVTHRLSVLSEVDRVLFIHNGELKAFGKFNDLIRKNAEFKTFVQAAEKEQVLKESPPLPDESTLEGINHDD